jgi:uncharacterized protein (TIGR02996 family)
MDELWRQVVEAPDDIGMRLVLADALIERGDPRGELIALQCRGADARVIVEREVDEDNIVERVNDLVAGNWDTWLGELAEIVVRQGSTYEMGMLATITVGENDQPLAVWERVAKHHELCAVRHVKPLRARSEPYGAFLAGLVNDPAYVEVSSPQIVRAIRTRRKQWRIRGIAYGGIMYFSREVTPGMLTGDFKQLEELTAATLETIDFTVAIGGDEFANVVLGLPAQFPNLRAITIDDGTQYWRQSTDPKLVERLEKMPLLKFV